MRLRGSWSLLDRLFQKTGSLFHFTAFSTWGAGASAMNSTLVIDADLIALHQPALLSYAARHVREPELARDLVQETWAAAITAADRFEGRAAVRTWLTAILRRKIADHHRRRRPSVSFEEHHARLVAGKGDYEGANPEIAHKCLDEAQLFLDACHASYQRWLEAATKAAE